MKKYVSTIIFISIIVISVLMGVRQYKNDESLKSKENEPQTEVSWATPWGKATMKKVADLNETESYDTTKSFYKDYDDTGLETCILTGIFADSEEEAIKQVRETGHCRYAYMTEDGKCEIKLTEKQKCWWIDSAKKSIQRVLDEANQLDGCIFEVNDNFTDLNVQISKEKKQAECHKRYHERRKDERYDAGSHKQGIAGFPSMVGSGFMISQFIGDTGFFHINMLSS